MVKNNKQKDQSSESDKIDSDDEEVDYLRWKENIPYLYDTFINHNLEWPCSSLAWGPIVSELKRVTKQVMFISQTTDAQFEKSSGIWRGCPNTIELCHVLLNHPSTILYSQLKNFNEEEESNKLSIEQRIIHPGEITKLKSYARIPYIIASHTVSKEVFVWNFTRQENRTKNVDQKANEPDLILEGHTDEACYALDFGKFSSKVASGGEDKNVLVWDLENRFISEKGNKIKNSLKLSGHSKSVLDVAFSPSNDCILASAGEDKTLIIWDLRNGEKPAMKIENIHKDDINTLSWNICKENIISTGSSDLTVKVTDLRYLDDRKTIFEDKMEENIISVSWNSTLTDYFIASDESGLVSIFNYASKQRMFNHGGHRSPVETVEWNSYFNHNNHLEWVIASSSNDAAKGLGGGTLQIWRPLDLFYKNQEDLIVELQKLYS